MYRLEFGMGFCTMTVVRMWFLVGMENGTFEMILEIFHW